MLNAKLWPGYWSEGQVLRIRELFSATLWTQFTRRKRCLPHLCRGGACPARRVCRCAIAEIAPLRASWTFRFRSGREASQLL